MLWWLSPTSAAARTTSPLSLSASPDLGRSKEYRSCGKLDSPEGKTNTKMSARVGPQWELPDVLARFNPACRTRLVGRRAHVGLLQPPCSIFVTALQAAFRTSTGSIRSGRQERLGRGKLLTL